MLGSILKLISMFLSILVFLPPIIGAGYVCLTTAPLPVFFPKDLVSKITYGATWGFWTTWQWIRPVAGMTGGAQVAATMIMNHTIDVPTTADDLNASQKWYALLNNVAVSAGNVATGYYQSYAGAVSVDVNQTWWITMWVVSNDGYVWLTRLDIVWFPLNETDPLNPTAAHMQLTAYQPSDQILEIDIQPHYGIVVTLDTVSLTEFMLDGSQIDWGKFSMNLLQTFYKGNIQVWTME